MIGLCALEASAMAQSLGIKFCKRMGTHGKPLAWRAKPHRSCPGITAKGEHSASGGSCVSQSNLVMEASIEVDGDFPLSKSLGSLKRPKYRNFTY